MEHDTRRGGLLPAPAPTGASVPATYADVSTRGSERGLGHLYRLPPEQSQPLG